MKFAHSHLEQEFMLIHPSLIYIVIACDAYLRTKHFCEILITHVYRTERHQRELYPNSPGRRSPHQDWRAVDGQLYSTARNEVLVQPLHSVIDEITRFCSLLLPEQKAMPVVIWEESSTSEYVSTAPHFHWQVQHDMPRTIGV